MPEHVYLQVHSPLPSFAAGCRVPKVRDSLTVAYLGSTLPKAGAKAKPQRPVYRSSTTPDGHHTPSQADKTSTGIPTTGSCRLKVHRGPERSQKAERPDLAATPPPSRPQRPQPPPHHHLPLAQQTSPNRYPESSPNPRAGSFSTEAAIKGRCTPGPKLSEPKTLQKVRGEGEGTPNLHPTINNR